MGPKCCACHAKRAGWAPNAVPATQTEAAPNVINRCRISADLYEGAPSAAPEGLQMAARARKTSRMGPKCCACNAKRARRAPNAAPATQTEAAPKVINRRRASVDHYEGAPSAAPATQNEPEGLQVLHLQRKARGAPSAAPATQNEPDGPQMPCLPRKPKRRPM